MLTDLQLGIIIVKNDLDHQFTLGLEIIKFDPLTWIGLDMGRAYKPRKEIYKKAKEVRKIKFLEIG